MSDNLEFWRSVSVTDPRAVKPITGKQYQGNSPKPYWIVERLTETFGMCGLKWGFTVLSERVERFGEHDSIHIARVMMWYDHCGERGQIEQIGQTKMSYMSGKDKFIVDEDAPKKSVTDALTKCASYLGFCSDIFSGRWDDSKYVASAAAHYAEKGKSPEEKSASDLLDKIRTAHDTGTDEQWARACDAYLALESAEARAALRKSIGKPYSDSLLAAEHAASKPGAAS